MTTEQAEDLYEQLNIELLDALQAFANVANAIIDRRIAENEAIVESWKEVSSKL